MGWQSPRLIGAFLLLSLGAYAPGAQVGIPVTDAAVLSELKAQTVLLNNILTDSKAHNAQLTALQAQNTTIIAALAAQRSDNDVWQQRQIFLLTAIALACGIFWGMATWLVVVNSASSKHFW